MSQLDLIYLAQPLIIIAATSLLLFWYYRKKVSSSFSFVLGLSAIAYFVAIVAKEVFQAELAITGLTPANPFVLGLSYGLQTCLLEVGLAYLIARFAVSNGGVGVEDAPVYGAGLAFWENGVLLGAITLIELSVIIATGGSGLATGSLGQVAQLVALGTLERVSSILAHFSWGVLAVVAAFSKKTKYLAAALPMGFVDFLVPFASSMSLVTFEAIVFAWGAACLAVTYMMTKDDWPMIWGTKTPPAALSPGSGTVTSAPQGPSYPSETPANVNNARCQECGAVFMASRNIFLPHVGPLVLRKCPACGRRSFMRSRVDEPLTWPGGNGRLK
jgi:ribosomal protein S27AE